MPNKPCARRRRKIPAEVDERLDSAKKLSDEDRKTIIEIAREALGEYLPAPDTIRSKRERFPESRKSHEQHDHQPAPEDRQCRKSSIRRPHHESPGRFEHQSIRAVGARAGRLLSHRGTGLGVCFRARGSASPMVDATSGAETGAIGAVVFGSDQGLVGQFNDKVADHASKLWPI
jgi:hypothetical protein